MGNRGDNERFSSTARLAEKDYAQIEKYVRAGYYSSVSGFVSIAIRDVAVDVATKYGIIYPIVEESISGTDYPGRAIDDLMIKTLRYIFVEETGYESSKCDGCNKLVNVTGPKTIIERSIRIIGRYVTSGSSFQDIVRYAVYYELKRAKESANAIDKIEFAIAMIDQSRAYGTRAEVMQIVDKYRNT